MTDMEATKRFLVDELGMKELSYDSILARTKGSQFEPPLVKGGVVMGYGEDTLSLLLVPANAAPDGRARKNKAAQSPSAVVVGGMLEAMTIVVDDSKSVEGIPEAAKAVMDSRTVIKSPDGYPFKIVSRTAFEKIASKESPEYSF